MKILLTGGSSFTGYWFIKALKEKGHTVTATFRGSRDQYTGVRKERTDEVAQWAEIVWECSFGDEKFIELLQNKYDIICHHGAFVENYRSPDFDIAGAFAANSKACRTVIEKAKEHGVKRIILTGSVFEANEGAGTEPLVAFSPYGLSKTITWETFRHWCWKLNMPLGKFVIPNPFGPYEEPRFCNYLISTWIKGEIPEIKTPDYIRDNIHVSKLAVIYANWVAETNYGAIEKLGPSGYIESQGTFAKRFAAEMQLRLPLTCAVKEGKQTTFDEPLFRVNTSNVLLADNEWNEKEAWDELAEFYKRTILNKK
jgi:UDP-glucose 4-epimerase